MKTLILIRHANALAAYEAGVRTDAERPLSESGQEKAIRTAHAIAAKQLQPEIIFTSPLVRACQTAEILAQTLHAPGCQETVLNGLHDEEQVAGFLTEQFETHYIIAAVGHNPNISYLTHLLCHEIHPFSPGSFAVIDMTQSPRLLYFGE